MAAILSRPQCVKGYYMSIDGYWYMSHPLYLAIILIMTLMFEVATDMVPLNIINKFDGLESTCMAFYMQQLKA